MVETSLQHFGFYLITIDREGQILEDTEVIMPNRSETGQLSLSKPVPAWSMRLTRNAPELVDKGIEFDVSLTTESLLMKYMQEVVVRAKLITQLKVTEKTQTAALDKLEEMQKAT